MIFPYFAHKIKHITKTKIAITITKTIAQQRANSAGSKMLRMEITWVEKKIKSVKIKWGKQELGGGGL